jgi:hypothetical protein
MNLRRDLLVIALLTASGLTLAAQDVPVGATSSQPKRVVEPSYAWRVNSLLGTRESVGIDTLFENYAQQAAIPSLAVSEAAAITGNYGAEGLNMLYFERPRQSNFFFLDALSTYLPSWEKQVFYNTRIPMTLVTYNTGGGSDATQDRLKVVFSGNANKRTQIGAHIDYIYSKGSYNYQADKNLTWGFNGSYLGDHYELQACFNQYNSLNKESGGITDDLYITDPAEVQGGSTNVNTKSIPTNLTAAHSRVRGKDLFVNNRYKVGFYRPLPKRDENDTIDRREFVPVTAFSWTLHYMQARHMFRDDSSNDNDFWENTYFTQGKTLDITRYWAIRNTFGISLLEGFNKWAKAGLSAFVIHEYARYTQTAAEVDTAATDLTPLPSSLPESVIGKHSLWVGGELARRQGRIINYSARAIFGVAGASLGDVDLQGDIDTKVPLWGDSINIHGYGELTHAVAPVFLNNYVSNHFIWQNDFSNTTRTRFGGTIYVPHTATTIGVNVEDVKNLVYFNNEGLPTQHSPNVQVFSASLQQNFKLGILHWDNRLTYQKSSNTSVLPLPDFTVYSNLYLLCKITTLHLQLGVDCDYFTSYNAMAYQPATMTFHTQNEVKVGNYPMCNVYANMKLSKVRFYVLYSHFNQGLFGGKNYFSLAHYPLNPHRFMLGLSIDFAN